MALRTLREIFIDNGLDPMDVFLLDEADMPAEAQKLLREDRAPDNRALENRDLSWSAAITHGTSHTE